MPLIYLLSKIFLELEGKYGENAFLEKKHTRLSKTVCNIPFPPRNVCPMQIMLHFSLAHPTPTTQHKYHTIMQKIWVDKSVIFLEFCFCDISALPHQKLKILIQTPVIPYKLLRCAEISQKMRFLFNHPLYRPYTCMYISNEKIRDRKVF